MIYQLKNWDSKIDEWVDVIFDVDEEGKVRPLYPSPAPYSSLNKDFLDKWLKRDLSLGFNSSKQ